ncbi:putative leader peptide [Streptomyces sp. CRN 30]|uniref:putative leader peptide n=1 Tax=Streptomyces sp. CRN 30 TaxID=3075613 RepID=UPI0039C3C945
MVARNGNIGCDRGVGSEEDPRAAEPRTRPREVTDVARADHAVHLYSRPHIDLHRVAGALCRR